MFINCGFHCNKKREKTSISPCLQCPNPKKFWVKVFFLWSPVAINSGEHQMLRQRVRKEVVKRE